MTITDRIQAAKTRFNSWPEQYAKYKSAIGQKSLWVEEDHNRNEIGEFAKKDSPAVIRADKDNVSPIGDEKKSSGGTKMEKYEVPLDNVGKLEEGFAKLAKRAEKLGMTPPKLIKGKEFDVKFIRTSDGGVSRIDDDKKLSASDEKNVFYRRYVECSCDGNAPVLDGWELISVIDHTTDPEIGNLIKNVPGKETPVQYRTAKPICEHCNHERRRNDTFLLKKDGKYKQIGRNCLADFCRSPEAASELIHSAEWIHFADDLLKEAGQDDEEGYGGVRAFEYHPIEKVLAITRAFIRKCGWTSKGMVADRGFGMATASQVMNYLTNPKWRQYATEEEKEAIDSMGDHEKEFAAKSLEWIRSHKDKKDEMNDYLYNLLVVCSQDRIPGKHFGLACSLIPAWMRDQEKQVEMKHKAKQAAESNYFGTVGKREDFTLTVVGLHELEGDYGVTTIVRMLDDSGNVAVWKASGSPDMDLDVKYKVKGTVKAHDVYRNTRQTVLSRCKYELVDPPAEESEEDEQKIHDQWGNELKWVSGKYEKVAKD